MFLQKTKLEYFFSSTNVLHFFFILFDCGRCNLWKVVLCHSILFLHSFVPSSIIGDVTLQQHRTRHTTTYQPETITSARMQRNVGGSNVSTQTKYITVAIAPVANFTASAISKKIISFYYWVFFNVNQKMLPFPSGLSMTPTLSSWRSIILLTMASPIPFPFISSL